jgi:hypothetical protein
MIYYFAAEFSTNAMYLLLSLITPMSFVRLLSSYLVHNGCLLKATSKVFLKSLLAKGLKWQMMIIVAVRREEKGGWFCCCLNT